MVSFQDTVVQLKIICNLCSRLRHNRRLHWYQLHIIFSAFCFLYSWSAAVPLRKVTCCHPRQGGEELSHILLDVQWAFPGWEGSLSSEIANRLPVSIPSGWGQTICHTNMQKSLATLSVSSFLRFHFITIQSSRRQLSLDQIYIFHDDVY